MESDADPEAAGLRAIYGRSSSKKLVTEWHTSVSYHDAQPVWNEEVKIKHAFLTLISHPSSRSSLLLFASCMSRILMQAAL